MSSMGHKNASLT